MPTPPPWLNRNNLTKVALLVGFSLFLLSATHYASLLFCDLIPATDSALHTLVGDEYDRATDLSTIVSHLPKHPAGSVVLICALHRKTTLFVHLLLITGAAWTIGHRSMRTRMVCIYTACVLCLLLSWFLSSNLGGGLVGISP